MAVEFELKYKATPEMMDKIRADFPGGYTVTEMTTTYYDTPDSELAKLHWTLRHRKEGDKHVCTLKTPAGIEGRREYEWICEDIMEAIPNLCRLSGSGALSELAKNGLIETCGARFTRTARRLTAGSTVVELALDQGVLTGGGKEEPLCEVEVELKAGLREETMVIGHLLAAAYELVPENQSKFARAKALGEQA